MAPQKTGEDGYDHSPTRRGIRFQGATEDRAAPAAGEQDAHVGVKKVEAALRIYGRYSRWCLFIGYACFLTTGKSTGGSFRHFFSLTRQAHPPDKSSRHIASLLHRTFTLSMRRPPLHTSLLRRLASGSTAC